jgi:hypothetical protein
VVTTFTLFWIPLFPTSTEHLLQCSDCGCSQQVSTEEAERLLASATAPAVPATEPSGGSMPPLYQDLAVE